MHVYFMTRGIMSMRNNWVDGMKTRMFPWKRKNIQTGQDEWKMVQGALRPIELWEYVLPKECLQECLTMQHSFDGKISVVNEVNNLRPEIKNYALVMQKLLGLKPFPKFEKPIQYGYLAEPGSPPMAVNWVPIDGFAVYPIGIKDDVTQDFPDFKEPGAEKGFHQEGL